MQATVPQHGTRKIISYSPLEVASVEEMMEPNKPLVKSVLPLTRPKGPSFEQIDEIECRRQERLEKRAQALLVTVQLNAATLAERKLIKAQMEFDREKRTALQTVYRMARAEEFRRTHSTSPFLTDLAAQSERAAELDRVRTTEAKRLQRQIERKKNELRTDVIVKACTEIDEAEERRKLHRRNLQAVRLERSFKDVMKAEFATSKRSDGSHAGSHDRSLNSTGVSTQRVDRSTASAAPSSIPHEESIADQAAKQQSPPPRSSPGAAPPSPQQSPGASPQSPPKDVPVYIAQRQQELAEKARLEEIAKQERQVQLKALEDALELKLSIDAADRERARQKRERLEKKRAEEAERKRKEVQDAREKAEEDARNQLEQQEKRARIKEAKKQQLADQWRADALGNRESVFAKMRSPEFKEVALFPPPPPSLLKKNQ